MSRDPLFPESSQAVPGPPDLAVQDPTIRSVMPSVSTSPTAASSLPKCIDDARAVVASEHVRSYVPEYMPVVAGNGTDAAVP